MKHMQETQFLCHPKDNYVVHLILIWSVQTMPPFFLSFFLVEIAILLNDRFVIVSLFIYNECWGFNNVDLFVYNVSLHY